MTRVLVAKTAARGAWRHVLETDDHDVLQGIGQNPAYTLSNNPLSRGFVLTKLCYLDSG